MLRRTTSTTTTTPKKESKLGGFLRSFRTSPSSPSVGGETNHSRGAGGGVPNDEPARTERWDRHRRSNSTTRSRSRARSRSRPRAKSVEEKLDGKKLHHGKLEIPRSPSSKPRQEFSKNSLRLRSKSPSRQRIQDFMNEVKAREVNVSTDDSRRSSRRTRGRSNDDRRWTQQFVQEESRDGSLDEVPHGSSSSKNQDFLSKSELGSLLTTTTTTNNGPSSSSSTHHHRSTSVKRHLKLNERNFDMGTSCRLQRSIDPSTSNRSLNQDLFYQDTLSSSERGESQPAGLARKNMAVRTPPVDRRTNSSPPPGSDNPESWFSAIERRDWERVDQLIQGYDYKKYTSLSTKPQKKLRVLKYFPSKKGGKGLKEKEEIISPLLTGDSKGHTPLHLGCKVYMPWKMLQSLFFLERQAVFVLDDDDRLPLHLAVIANHDTRILNKFIHGNPASLLHPDAVLGRTPLGYAIVRANYKQDNTTTQSASWRTPLNGEESKWQSEHVRNWTNVKFLLETFVSRRKLLSKVHDSTLLLESARAVAPPAVMNDMLSVSARILQQDRDMANQLLNILIVRDYPVDIIRKTLKICSETFPQELLMKWMRRAMVEQYDKGRILLFREEFVMKTTFQNELVQTYIRMAHKEGLCLTSGCQEWWDTLKLLMVYSAEGSLQRLELDEQYLLHSACMIPESPPQLIETLVRLFPSARFEVSPQSGALPIHLLCRYWNRESWSEQEVLQTFNSIVGGKVSLAGTRYRNRTPLHYAILGRQPWSLIKTISLMNPETVHSPDPSTRLYPFQLAAISEFSSADEESNRENLESQMDETRSAAQLDIVYKLLRQSPVTVNPTLSCGSGDPKADIGPVARHVLCCCYSYNNNVWVLDHPRLQILRGAIANGKIPEELREWYDTLKTLIWRVYDMKNSGKRIVYMPHEDLFLLHAALSNGGTPPIAIELLLEVFPESIRTPKPGTEEYPIHIAAESASYTPMPFETFIPMPSALEMMVLAYPRAVRLLCCGRTVLHMAISSGKLWNEIKPLLDTQPVLVGIRDQWNGLLPYQHVAAQESSMPLETWMHSKTFATVWSEKTSAENALLLSSLRRDFHCNTLSTIYELLHRTVQAGARRVD